MKAIRPHLLVLGVLAVVALTGLHQAWHHALADKRFNWFQRQATGDIVLVAIDSPSIEKIGVWPWPRRLHAELIDQLDRAKVTDIVFDVDFSSPSDPASDAAFRAALQKAQGSVVLPSFKQFVEIRGAPPSFYFNQPLPAFAEQSWSALVNVALERDGLARRYPYAGVIDGKVLPSIASMLAGNLHQSASSFAIDFSIRADSVPVVSYWDVLRGDAAILQSLSGKKVVIGAKAIELGDRFNVPNGHVIPGALLQILAAETIVQGRVLALSSQMATVLGIAFIGLLMILLWRRIYALWRVAMLFALALLIEAVAVVLQGKFAVVVDTSLLQVAIAAYLAVTALDEIDFHSLLGSVAEKRFQRIAMSLGDGLVCADHGGLITVWNPGAEAIFGYRTRDMIGQPFHLIYAGTGSCCGEADSFRLTDLPSDELQAPGGLVKELEGTRQNGERFALEMCLSGWQGADGFHYGAVLRDVTVRKREAERIRYLAGFDTLTGLANRTTLHESLNNARVAARTEGSEVALLLMDLDNFKEINDSLGHAFGDQVLYAVASRLKELAGTHDVVARLGGDEFAMVLAGADASARARQLAESITGQFATVPMTVDNREMRVGGSIGIAVYPNDCETTDELLGNADLALYRAKASGPGCHRFFDHDIRRKLEKRLALEVELQRAVECREFELFYQPQVDLRSGNLIGAEALIRWRHPDRGLVSPAEFMPVINTSQFSDRVALWVLEEACRQSRIWQNRGHEVCVGVNLSPSQFQSDLAATVARVLADTGCAPHLLELEVTENILLEDDTRARDIFRRIQELGVPIAFDDFGTGYASLSYLKKFPLNVLKIDQSFVREMLPGSDDAAIVSSTVSLGKLLGLTVIAEGIENQAVAELLIGMGCEHGQGYHYGRPMPAPEFEQKFLNVATCPPDAKMPVTAPAMAVA